MATATAPDFATADYLASEIASAEEALEATERKKLLLASSARRRRRGDAAAAADDDDNVGDDDAVEEEDDSAATTRFLARQLDRSVDDLLLAKDVAEWVRTCLDRKRMMEEEEREEDDDFDDADFASLRQDCLACLSLGKILLRHEPPTPPPRDDDDAYRKLYADEYLPLYRYVRAKLAHVGIRRTLRNTKYPSPDGCTGLLEEAEEKARRRQDDGGGDNDDTTTNNRSFSMSSSYVGNALMEDDTGSRDTDFSRLATACEYLIRLEYVHDKVLQRVGDQQRQVPGRQREPGGVDLIVLEFCRPFVERLRYHFVEKKGGDSERSGRVDRLPEWLFSYLREHFLADGGPWDLIAEGLATATPPSSYSLPKDAATVDDDVHAGTALAELPLHVLNELVRMIQWVFGERNFFRDTAVSGPNSKPLLLCGAVQQLLLFDQELHDLLPRGPAYRHRLLSLMDVFVAGDDELLQWWLEREKEAAFAALFDDQAIAKTPALVHRIAPRAELFCALMKSVQAKTALFSFSGPYWSYVAAPLCTQFVDMIHETVLDLRQRLSRRTVLEKEGALEPILTEWMELINGTHMAAQVLLSSSEDGDGVDSVGEVDQKQGRGESSTLDPNQDVIRFGRSLQNLEGVLVEEFGKTFVEVCLMERAKFASYLMRCSNLLLMDRSEDEDWTASPSLMDLASVTSVSPDLGETVRLLGKFSRLCDDASMMYMDDEDERAKEAREAAQFAPRAMLELVLNLVADKLLEVELNYLDMTPDLLHYGCAVFEGDIKALFGTALLPPLALRVVEISRVMAMESTSLAQIGSALCGLAGHPAPLTEDLFEADERLYEEAMSMLRAKGLVWVQLGDCLSILNRRRELMSAIDRSF